jgi:hypothetical protein
VRASAIRLRRVWLRNKSADQLKRAEIWTWITFGLLFAAAVAVAAVNFNGDRLFYGVLALLSAITLLFSSLTMRRIRRNVALLAGRPQLGPPRCFSLRMNSRCAGHHRRKQLGPT